MSLEYHLVLWGKGLPRLEELHGGVLAAQGRPDGGRLRGLSDFANSSVTFNRHE